MNRKKKINRNYYGNKAKRRTNPNIRKIVDGKVASFWSDEPKTTVPKSRKLKKKLKAKLKGSNKNEVTENS